MTKPHLFFSVLDVPNFEDNRHWTDSLVDSAPPFICAITFPSRFLPRPSHFHI